MTVIVCALVGVFAAYLVIRSKRQGQVIGYRRHLIAGALAAVVAGVLYGNIVRIPINEFEITRFILCSAVALVAVYLSIALAKYAQGLRR